LPITGKIRQWPVAVESAAQVSSRANPVIPMDAGEVPELARQHTGEATKTLVAIMIWAAKDFSRTVKPESPTGYLSYGQN
jgi:hypothetical protein